MHYGKLFLKLLVQIVDPIQAWAQHNDNLHEKVDYLNKKAMQNYTIQHLVRT